MPSFYDEQVRPEIDADPNRIASMTNLDLQWRWKEDKWIATSVPYDNPWRVKGDPSRIVFRPGELGPYVYGLGRGGTWLALVNDGQEPHGQVRTDLINEIAKLYGLRPPTNRKKADQEWAFTSTCGQQLRLRRWNAVKGIDKTFAWSVRQGEEWVPGLQGLSVQLYKICEVDAAIQSGDRVYLAEGCKTADALARLGVTATTAPHGRRLDTGHCESLRGGRIVLAADADLPGRDYVRSAGRDLVAAANSVHVLDPFPARWDGSDFADYEEEVGAHDPTTLISSPLLLQKFSDWDSSYEIQRALSCFPQEIEHLVGTERGKRILLDQASLLGGPSDSPMARYILDRLKGSASDIEREIVEQALLYLESTGEDDFATDDLLAWLFQQQPLRWSDWDGNGRAMTRNKLGTILKDVGAPSYKNPKGLRRRRRRDVERAAKLMDLAASSPSPGDLGDPVGSPNTATLDSLKSPTPKPWGDSGDSESSLITTRELEISYSDQEASRKSKSATETTEGVGQRSSSYGRWMYNDSADDHIHASREQEGDQEELQLESSFDADIYSDLSDDEWEDYDERTSILSTEGIDHPEAREIALESLLRRRSR